MAPILIAILVCQLFLFVPQNIQQVNAQITPQGPGTCTFNPKAPKTYKSRVYVDKADGVADRTFDIGQANVGDRNVKPVNTNEDITYYVDIVMPADQVAACKDKTYELGIWGYAGLAPLNRVRFTPNSQVVNNELHLFWKFTINASNIGQLPESPDQTTTYIYACEVINCSNTDIAGSEYIEKLNIPWRQTPADPEPSTPPSAPLLEGSGGGQNVDQPVDYTTIKTKITANQNGNGLRSKYRVLWSDNSLDFGLTQGLDGIHMEWAGTPIASGQYFTLPHKDDNWGITFQPYYGGSSVYFGDYQTLTSKGTIACKPGWTYTDCSDVVFSSTNPTTSSTYNKGKESPIIPVPNDFNPSLLKAAWQSKVTAPTSEQTQNGNNGKPLGTVDFGAIPAIIGFKLGSQTILNPRNWVIDDTVIVLSGGGNIQKVTVEVYATNADIITACKADSSVTDKTQCDDINFAKYRSGSTITQTTNPTEGQAPKTLFGFILEVIAYIVVAITSVIYWIFSYVLVPVLNALIRIHPFRDTFVNVVYPGWLIMRNLANIAFIIALLIMGLMTLFQVSNANKTRSLIVWLILMALLVNFSLVIAQGVVAIADTVQSQFLPGNTQVIEALGKALMADPAIQFQTKISGIEDGSATASLFTPIMLLITSVAGFFAFLAITAFVAVRTVMLWVFYLTSPFAYFGQVLDQTRGWAKRWWMEFLKYAFMVPILAFFLNIAALMAGTLAKQSSINPQATSGLFTDQAIASVEGVTLTIISQAVVLLFLLAGIRFAVSTGTIGAKAITNFAEKGFKNAFKKPAQWAATGKDIAADLAARGAKRAGAPNLAKAITAAAKPVDLAAATKKKWMDDAAAARKKRQAEALADIPLLTRSKDAGKLGGSLKGAKAKMKDFERDDADYLGSRMAEGYKKSDGDTLNGAMLKMAQEGHFKDMLAEGGHLTRKTYTEDAAGLNQMTADMVKKGKISEANRTDLLDEFDKAAKKQRKNVHYGGNTSYDRATDKTVVRKTDPQHQDGFARTNTNDPYADSKGWTMTQIKARVGNDPKGSLKKDLTEAHLNAAVKNGQLTDAQIGVFAHASDQNITDRKIWIAAEAGQEEKMQAMREALSGPDAADKIERVRQRMIQYYEAVPTAGGTGNATDKANARMAVLQTQLFNRAPVGQEQRQGGGDQIGYIRQNRQNQNQPQADDDDDDDDDEEAHASAGGTTTVVGTPTVVTSPTMSSTSQPHDDIPNPIGDPVFGDQTASLSRGSASIISSSNSEKNKNVEDIRIKGMAERMEERRAEQKAKEDKEKNDTDPDTEAPPTTDQPSPTPA